MTTNESRIYGTLLILASLMVIALVVMGAPEREKVKCEGYNLSFKIEEDRDTFMIGEWVRVINQTNDVSSLKWIVSDVDSIVSGESMDDLSLILVFTREGEKKIQLKINDREECTTVAKRIFIMPNCSDGIQNGSETGIDCGGNCPPCGDDKDKVAAVSPRTGNTSPPPPPPIIRPTCWDGIQNGSEAGVDCGGNCARRCPDNTNLPRAYIIRIAGEQKCQTDITFDCGIPPQYNPTWSFADTGDEKFSGRRVTHKFRNEGIYTIRVYIGNTQVGQKQFDIAACTGGTPVIVDPQPQASIILPNPLNCKEVLRFRSTSKQADNRIRWEVNGVEETGASLYHTFEQTGTYTVKLYIGSSYTPIDTRTFNISCEREPAPVPVPTPTPTTPSSNIKLYNLLKTRLQEITDESARAFRVVTKTGPKYQRILGDPSLCGGGSTIVKINNDGEKTLDEYFDQIIKEQYVISEVRIKKDGNCIEKILINHNKK